MSVFGRCICILGRISVGEPLLATKHPSTVKVSVVPSGIGLFLNVTDITFMIYLFFIDFFDNVC